MKTNYFLVSGLIVIAVVTVILVSGFEEYHAYSERGDIVLKKEYAPESASSIFLRRRQIFEKQPFTRLLVSGIIAGSFLLYLFRDEEFARYRKPGKKQFTPQKGLTLHARRAHPKYPQLFITKIAYDGTIKVKGLGGFRDPQLPFVRGLTRRQRAEFRKVLSRLERERKRSEQAVL